MALAEYAVELDQDYWITLQLENATDWHGDTPATATIAPGLLSISPVTKAAGAPPFTLQLTGSGFKEYSRVIVALSKVVTATVVSSTNIGVSVDLTKVDKPGVYTVEVVNGSKHSPTQDFTVT